MSDKNVNKVSYDGKTLMDLTNDTVSPQTLTEGVTAHDASGAAIVGVAAKGVYFIQGTGSTAGTWLGEHPGITELFDGLTVAYKVGIAGASTTTLNINGLGAKKVVRNVSTAVTTNYGVNSVVLLTYTVDSGTGYWKISDYDSDTKTRSSNKADTKMYLIGAQSQSTSGQTTYSNANCYIGADNQLYSGGKKVSTKDYDYPTPLDYGAVGDGSTDDTTAFQNALADNRVVFVPGGTYKLSSGLTINGNCCLELSQDTVLEFTQTSGNCISLKMSASIKGNHATITVPYTFGGNVIYVSTTLDPDVLAIPPWTRWTPQWKAGRYITDLNITKANSSGFHYSNDGTCYGTAVYISADNSGTVETRSTFIWGLNFSGLGIAGGFNYGIRAQNFNNAWNHEMRVEAFIEACKIGVSLEHCNNAYISAIIQPRAASNDATYAVHGIKLDSCENTDLIGSRVWDWNANNSLWSYDKSNVNQHIAMYGNCIGTIMNDYLYHYLPSGFNDIRELIYCEPAYKDINLNTLVVLQEPITRWFRPEDNEPYFNNGVDGNQRLSLKKEVDAYFDTAYVPDFTDVLAQAGDGTGGIYNEIGYKHGYSWATDGKNLVENNWATCSGYIPCASGETLYFDEMSMKTNANGESRIILFDSNYEKIVHVNQSLIITNGSYYNFDSYTETEKGFSIRIVKAGAAFLKINVDSSSVGTKPVVSRNEPIRYTQVGVLADGIHVKEENLTGMEKYERTGRMTTAISASSTDAQYPSAKAVYTALSNALGSYVNDIAALVGGDA